MPRRLELSSLTEDGERAEEARQVSAGVRWGRREASFSSSVALPWRRVGVDVEVEGCPA